MSRKWLLIVVFCLLTGLSGGIWYFWTEILQAIMGFQALDKDQLELWGKQRDLVWPVVFAIAGAIWAFWRFVWSKVGAIEKTGAEQRRIEQEYLKNLLHGYDLYDVKEAYTHQSGDMQKHERIPERFFKAHLRYDRHQAADEPHQANTEPEHHTDLLTAFAKHKRLVLLGEPGMGKTFSLWRIAAEYASHALRDAHKPIPVILPLNEWINAQQTLDEFMLEHLHSLKPFHDSLLRNKRLLLLLDALNEIPVDQRETKLPQVKALIRQRDYPALLLTCRLRDYTLDLAQDLDRLTIEPLTPPRIQAFLHNYFHHLFQRGTNATQSADQLFWQLAGGENMQQAWQRWKTYQPDWKARLRHYFNKDYTHPDWDNFWHAAPPQGWYWKQYRSWSDDSRLTQLNNPRSLLKLAENPYLLSMMARIFHKQGKLPDSRRELFEEFVSVLLSREQDDKNREKATLPPADKLKTKLKLLAWELQSQGSGIDEARTTLLRMDAERLIPDTWIKFAHDQSVLLITGDKVRFSHQLLQEFFTAQSFKERRESGWKASQIWPPEKWWQPNGWEVATELAYEYEANAVDTNPVPFLNWLAEGNPTLAAKIAREKQISDDALFVAYRGQWQKAIMDIEKHPNPHERHAISTVLAWQGWDDRPGISLNRDGLPGIHWVKIPVGKFIYQENEEQPLPAFFISRYPITNAQFQAFTEDGGFENDEWWTGIKKPKERPEHRWTEANRPVETVSWYDASAFCRWLSAKTGLEISLPTEQQWEKAARGKDGLKYPWGKEYISGYANIDETWGHDKVGEYNLGETSAVGIYPQRQDTPSAQIADMSGNVWEWCLNKHHESETITPDRSDDVRVLRGGSWDYDSENCRSAYRLIYLPNSRFGFLGFRVVCLSPPISDH